MRVLLFCVRVFCVALQSNIPVDEIPKFKDPKFWLEYFPPYGEQYAIRRCLETYIGSVRCGASCFMFYAATTPCRPCMRWPVINIVCACDFFCHVDAQARRT